MRRSKFGALVFGIVTISVLAGQSPQGASLAHAGGAEEAPNSLAPVLPAEVDVPISAGLKATMTPAPMAVTAGSCPSGMVEVEGEYCPALEQRCLRWLDPETKLRCGEFAPTGPCQTKTVRKHFCIDRFEFPNKAGEKPTLGTTWYESRDACRALGKRLCRDSEWTLACEGQERLPYPYGYARNADACNIDKPHPTPNEAAMFDPRRRAAEFARLDQRDPSGSREGCVSPYGVSDMAGNVDEWVVNESAHPYQSGSKGGYWGPVRTRCRPMTTAHYEHFSFYQLGFRCCADPKGPQGEASGSAAGGPAKAAPPANVAARLAGS